MMKFAIANLPCPLLNIEDFARVFTFPLPVNSKGFLSAIELVALPGTIFQLIEQKSTHIFQVALEGYSEQQLFADARFFKELQAPAMNEKKRLPTKEEMLKKLEEFEGLSYIWGGNWHQGIPQLLEYYPSPFQLDGIDQKKWTLQGVDCSGLLYEISQGYTPRNTSKLVHFGASIKEGDWIELLQPLDFIVWVGHIVFILDAQTTIESSYVRGGVVTTDLKTRLSEIIQERGDAFSVRRWI